MALAQKLYLLLPNHTCPNKKGCPFHPPEEMEEEEEEAEIMLVNKRRSFSTEMDGATSQEKIAAKLASINQEISSRLVDSQKLHLPRKSSQDINMPQAELQVLKQTSEMTSDQTVVLSGSTREESIASDYESTLTLDSGIMYDSWSDGELIEEELHPLLEEDLVIPDVSIVEELMLKNGDKLPEDDDRHRTTFKEGEATLQISDLKTEDAASYTCQAVNQLGEAETSANVTVEEVRHRRKRLEEPEASIRLKRPANEYDFAIVDTNIPPEFTLPLVDQSRAVGDEVTFTVTVTCRPEPDITWYHGDELVARSSRISFQHDKGVYRMTLLDLRLKDAGEYRCQAINAYGEEWCSCELKVIETIPEGHTKPRFVRELEYTSASEGSLVRLECVVSGSPKPAVKWFKDRQRIETDGHYKIRSLEDGTSTLVIEGVEVEDTGCYMCCAENDAGSCSSEAKMRVQAVYDTRPSADLIRPTQASAALESTSPYKKYRTQVPPDFTAKLKDRRVPEGTTARLNCSVTGIPEPTISWFRDGKEIFDGHDYTMRNNYGLLTLEVVYAKQSLSGKYTVEAKNSEGSTSSSCELVVEGDEDMESIELEILRPRFTTLIEDITVNEGEDATFTCVATGKPLPAFKWQRDMINLYESRNIFMEYDNQGNATLTLRRVKPSDAGLYYCLAQSRSGRAKCSARLNVRAKSPSPLASLDVTSQVQKRQRDYTSLDRGREALGSSPTFALSLPKSIDVPEGERLKLDCSVMGLPQPLVTWHKGDRELMYNQRHRIIMYGTLHTMEIPSCMTLDKGEYIVRATNCHGYVESRCRVTVVPAGTKVSTPPDYRREAMREAARESNQENADVEAALYSDEDPGQTEAKDRKRPQAPFFIKHLPKSIDVMTGIDVRLDCILRRGIELVRWSSSSPIPTDSVDSAKKELADEGFEGEFIPLDEKSSPKEEEEKKQPDQDGRLRNPSFLKQPVDMVRPIGGEAVFECTVDGEPEPEVKWHKDGRLIISNDGTRISSSGNKHKLRIKSVIHADEGEYTCKARSKAGENSCTATLSIEKPQESDTSKSQAIEEEMEKSSTDIPTLASPPPAKPEPASFSLSLPPNTSANAGDDVELVCEVKGGNVASVRWEKEGKDLPKEARYLVSCEDRANNRQKLTIIKAIESDMASFSCVVTLEDGDLINTSTQLQVFVPTKQEEEEEDFKPHFTSTLQDTVVRDGEGLTLDCDIEGNPRPQISWFRDGYEIMDSQDFQISMIGSHCKLQVADIYPEDEGKYSCRAVNALGEATSFCYVTVEDPYMSADSASTTSSRSHANACHQVKVTE